jgi:hypothetical protein
MFDMGASPVPSGELTSMMKPGQGSDAGRIAKLFVFPILLVTVLIGTYVPAMHSPKPHDVPIAIAGDAQMAGPVVESLQQATGESYEITVLPDAESAREAVQDRSVSAALVLAPAPEDRESGTAYQSAVAVPADQAAQAPVVYVASAASPSLTTVGLLPLQNLTTQLGSPAVVRDLVPLAADDGAGIGLLYFTLGVTLSAYVGITVIGTGAPDLFRFKTLATALPAFGVIMSLFVWLLTDVILGVVHGPVLPLLITGFLNFVAVGFGAALIFKIVGPLSTLVTMFIFVALGMTTSGAAIPVEMVPSFYRALHDFMPFGATTDAVRSIMYFDNAGIGHSWLVLAAWIVAMVAGYLLYIRIKPETPAKGAHVAAHVSGETHEATTLATA